MRPFIKHRIQSSSNDPISAVKFDNGKTEAGSSNKYTFVAQQNKLSLFNLASGTEVLEYETFTNVPVSAIELLENDKIVTSSNQILIHDKASGVPVMKFETMNVDYRGKNVNDIKVLSDNGLILSCDMDLRIWDLRQSNKYKPIQEFKNHSSDFLNSLDFSNGGVVVSCGGNDGKIYTYDLRSDLLHVDDRFNGSPITSVKYQHDSLENQVLLVNVLSHGSQLIDMKTEAMIYQLKPERVDKVYKIESAFLPQIGSQSLYRFVSGSEYGKLYYYNGTHSSSLEIYEEQNEESYESILSCLDVSTNGDIVVGNGSGGILCIDELSAALT
jgi:WD40 repeat protein